MTSKNTQAQSLPELYADESWLEKIPGHTGSDGGMERIVAETLQASSLEELFGESEAEGLADYEGRVITITDVSLRESDYDEGLSHYAVLQAIDVATGQVITLTTGSARVLAQLARSIELGLMPVTVVPKVIQSKTNKGRSTIRLVLPNN